MHILKNSIFVGAHFGNFDLAYIRHGCEVIFHFFMEFRTFRLLLHLNNFEHCNIDDALNFNILPQQIFPRPISTQKCGSKVRLFRTNDAVRRVNVIKMRRVFTGKVSKDRNLAFSPLCKKIPSRCNFGKAVTLHFGERLREQFCNYICH